MPEHQQTQKSKEPKPTSQKRATHAKPSPISSPMAIIQCARIDPKSLTAADVLQLQHTIGNRAVGRLLSEIRNPTKVQQVLVQRHTVSEEEKEPLQGMFGKKPEEETCPSCIQKQEIPEEEEPLQGKMIRTVQRQEIPEEEHLEIKIENNTGIPDNLKAGVESLSGIDMSDVRVHNNSSKPAEIGALAYTQGANIHVSPGQERHLPHEVWHVVQQAQGRVQPTLLLKGLAVNDEGRLEREADVMGKIANEKNNENEIIHTFQGIETTICNNKLIQCTREQIDALKSQAALKTFQMNYGGTTQNTLALIRTANNTHYAIEQETTSRVHDQCLAYGIVYIPQGRISHYHAEMRFINYADNNSININDSEIWVSKPICGDCTDQLNGRRFQIQTSTTTDRYRQWRGPDLMAPVTNPRGRFVGRRSEVDMLRDWNANT